MLIAVVALAAAAIFVIAIYNGLVRSRNRVDAAWSDIDVQLQKRHDLVPQLVKAVSAYTKYERATIMAVTELRAEALRIGDVDALGDVEEKLEQGVGRLLALAENYPDLKADRNFLDLQDELVATENSLQFARRYYNGSVRDHNTRVASVPNNLVAGRFGFDERPFFQKRADEVGHVPLVDLGSVE